MKFINFLIDVTNQSYDTFEQYMSEIFDKVFIEEKNRDDQDAPTDQEAQQYKEKVKKYTKYSIGRKISKNILKYTK